jgi:transposase-like protein
MKIRAGRSRRYSAAERTSLLQRYEASGQSQAAFCLAAGISVPTLVTWRKQASSRLCQAQIGKLLEVSLPTSTPLEVVLEVKGCTLSASVGVSPQWLGAVVRELRR